MRCEKRAFITQGAADKELKRIKSANDKLKKKKRKIPVRSYKCPDCGYYHHTKRALQTTPVIDVDLKLKEKWDELLKKQDESNTD